MFVHELIERQAARTPDAPAVAAAGGSLSYAELNANANRLARHFIAGGAGPESRVAVLLSPSVELVTALLAILKSGAAYVPIDPEYPRERVEYMVADSDSLMALDRMPEVTHYRDDNLTRAERRAVLHDRNAAYLIYTSGSTGRPKGVVVEHRSLSNHIQRTAARYPGVPGSSLIHSSIAFDLTVTPLYAQLCSGGQVWLGKLTDEAAARAPQSTLLKATPSHLEILAALPDHLSPTAALVLGGEPLSAPALDGWRAAHPDVAVYNSYGPTEATVNCCEFQLHAGTRTPVPFVPIGQPVGDARIYLLDDSLREVGAGEVGELYVAGPSLARGYWNRPGLTAERFPADPFGAPGQRMFRTGDLARRLPGGLLEFAGRVDQQVKFRGFRVELGEIESALRGQAGVAQAAAVVRRRGPDKIQLAGFVVATAGSTLDPVDLQRRIARWLPEHMVPSVTLLSSLPLSPNGKVDRAALARA